MAALTLVCALAMAGATAAFAQSKGKSIQTEAEWISYDEAAKTVTVKVKKPGRGDAAQQLKKNKEATFRVEPEGSVLTRTTVTINGMKADFADMPVGKTVNIYWRPEKDGMFARKIDAILSEAELDERERQISD